jgi:YidC/Oxa1 family membrane protein insertase
MLHYLTEIERVNVEEGEKPSDVFRAVLVRDLTEDAEGIVTRMEERMRRTGNTGLIASMEPVIKAVREKLEKLKERFAGNDRIEVQLDFSATDTVWKADLLITDWSDISMEYSFCTHKPVLFINTPMKIMNPEYDRIDVVPINIEIRDIVGCNISPKELDKIPEKIEYLFANSEMFAEKIREYEEAQVYNIGHSAEVGGRYVATQLLERTRNKK